MSKRKRARSAKTRFASKVRVEAARRQITQPSSNAGDFETGAGACPAARPERRDHRHRHALHWLATAHGARLPRSRGAQKLALKLESNTQSEQ